MSLVGNLEDLGLAEILQIVSLSKKSGILAIHNESYDSKIVFHLGEVVKADSTAYPGDLGDALLKKGIIDRSVLSRAQIIQVRDSYSRRLGDILIEEFNVDANILEDTAREFVEHVVFSLFAWKQGIFDFELFDDVFQNDDIRNDHLQYSLKKGISPQYLVMEGLRLFDESRNSASKSELEKEMTSEIDGIVNLEFDLAVETESKDETEVVEAGLPSRQLILVDDDETTRTVISELLRERGYVVSSFSNGEETLTGIDSYYKSGLCPTLVIDLIMPRIDGTGLLGGLELLELINSYYQNLPAIVVTDHHNPYAARQVSNMGCSLIGKPSKSDILNRDISVAFCERLCRILADLEAGEPPELSDTVNIGDEIRVEMGQTEPGMPVVQSTGISLLRRMLEELSNPSLGGGIILLVLRFASEFMSRAVIFKVTDDKIIGLGQFGISNKGESADMRVLSMKIPRSEKTIFSEVVETQAPVKIQLDNERWSRYLCKQLGGDPVEAFLGPIVSDGKVMAILYGDNGDDKKPIGDTDSLEIFLSQAGIAMGKALQRRKTKGKRPEGT